MHERFLRIKEVKMRTGFSKSMIYKKMTEGSFPRQIKIGLRACAWSESAIDQWVTETMGDAQRLAPKKGGGNGRT